MILDKLQAYGWQALAIAAGVLLLVQTARLHTEQLAHERLKTADAQAGERRAGAALQVEKKTAADESAHAQRTQENSDAFTQGQPARAAVARADLDRAERLRRDAERRAATYRAAAESNAAACSGLADRLEALDAHIVRGVGVVAGLRGDLARRDAEVVLLRGQIDADRALLAGEP